MQRDSVRDCPFKLPKRMVHIFNQLMAVPGVSNDISERILAILESYLIPPTQAYIKTGRGRLLVKISSILQSGSDLELVIPAFPMKSPSPDKVLGAGPDLGEVLALAKLEALASDIAQIYPRTHLAIISDGVVYQDLVGVSEEHVIQYGKDVRALALEHGFRHLRFWSLDLLLRRLGLIDAGDVLNFAQLREKMLSFLPQDPEIDRKIKEDVNVRNVYCGFLRFLEEDLKYQDQMTELVSRTQRKNRIKTIARQMMTRTESLTQLIQASCGNSVRLSIHGHNNQGPKYAIDLLAASESTTFLTTPWHNVICCLADGTYRVCKNNEVDTEKFELVLKDGKLWYYRARTSDFDAVSGLVDVTPLYPCGILVTPRPGVVSLDQLPLHTIRSLGLNHSLVLFRGFESLSQDEFRSAASQIGSIQSWVFGDILVVKSARTGLQLNNVLTNEAMPMHFDGTFKTQLDENGNVVPDAPLFQFFHCAHAGTDSDDQGGQTLFADTNAILRRELIKYGVANDQDIKCKISTPKNDSFGGDSLSIDLVQTHPLTGCDILRYHEPWPQSKTSKNPTDVSLSCGRDYVDPYTLKQITPDGLIEVIDAALFSRQFCFRHTWLKGDFVLADNFALMHMRTAFADCDRELWRIHLN